MKNENEQKARLSNIQLLNRRAAQRGDESAEDSKLESSLIREISKEIEARVFQQSPGENFALRAVLNDAVQRGVDQRVLELAEKWHESAVYFETAADFYDKRYGRCVENYYRMKERADALRECVYEILLSPLSSNP